MPRSSCSGSTAGLLQPAASTAASTAKTSTRSITDYHSVVTPDADSTLRIVTYNIHRCRGMDRRTRPDRVAEVLRETDADVIALQEVVGAAPQGGSQIEEIGALLGMGWVMASTRHLRTHLFGNVVLSRH